MNVRLDFVYDASATLIGVNTVEGHYFYIRDISGNILGLIDNEGNYKVKYKYDAWGKVLENKICKSCIASRHNPFVYKGYFLDEETGFYYLKSRYYDPVIRRFIQSMDLQGLNPLSLSGLNPFSYANNNPIGIVYRCYSVGRGISGGMVYSIGDVSNIDLGEFLELIIFQEIQVKDLDGLKLTQS